MLSHRRPPTVQGALPVCLFLCAVLYTAVVTGACGCYSCVSGHACALRTDETGDASHQPENFFGGADGEEDVAVPYAEFQINNRWSTTATGGSTGAPGSPITLTWGIVADGTPITGNSNTPSDLIAMLNDEYGAGPGGVPNAPWFRLFESAFGRWSELSGVTYVYEPNDGGLAIDNTAAPVGRPGFYADVRIGGHSIDGGTGSNTLAYNYYPNHSDMVLDTDNAAFYGDPYLDSRRLRNVLMHEAGHGLGFFHIESNNSGQLMEPFISTAFDGPQIDDILAAHRNYGDVLEKNGGNDTRESALSIGSLGTGDVWSLGTDGDATVVTPDMTDFVSIDGATDRDYFRFTVSERVSVRLEMSQVGPTYNVGPQGGEQASLVTSQLNPLDLTLYRDSALEGLAVLADAETVSVTGKLIDALILEPGADYLLDVRGTLDNVQLYRLDLAFTAVPVPEPLALASTVVGLVGGLAPRRSVA